MEEIYTGIIDKIIGNETKGVDHYNHNGSTWLIFTDEKKWVIEFTKEGTLWYNYNFFQNCFKLMSLDVVENQHYITKWVEDTIINGVRNTDSWVGKPFVSVEYTIQNGVKEIELHKGVRPSSVEDTIINGVKHTEYGDWLDGDERFDDIIQNGVKETKTPGEDGDIMGALDFLSDKNTNNLSHLINDVIEKGIKQTEGIKETWGYEKQPQKRIDDVIMNGQKD